MENCKLTDKMVNTIVKNLKIEKTLIHYCLYLHTDICRIVFWAEENPMFFYFSPKYQGISPTYVDSQRAYIYNVKEELVVPFAIEMLRYLLKRWPWKMNFIFLRSDVFDRETNIPFIFSFISYVKRVYHLEINGDGKDYSATCSQILNELTVYKSLSTSYFPADETLNYRKLSKISIILVNLLSATSLNIFDCAAVNSIFSVDKFSIRSINHLMRMWMYSKLDHIESIRIVIKNAEKENIEGILERLIQVKGTKQPCCGYQNMCNDKRCLANKLAHLQKVGFKLVRHDGAYADVVYSLSLPKSSFSMLISYPHKKFSYELPIDPSDQDSRRFCEKKGILEIDDKKIDELGRQISKKNVSSKTLELYKSAVFLWDAGRNDRERELMLEQIKPVEKTATNVERLTFELSMTEDLIQ